MNRKENSNDYILGEDYIRNEQYIASLPHVISYPDLHQGDASEACISMSHYAKFRLSWVLIKRNRPVIPCPEITPLPSRKSTKYVRAKLCSIYLRPWTLISSLATSEVPFLTDLDLTKEQYEKLHPNGTIGPVVKKYRKTKTVTTLDNEAEGVDRDMRRAWKDYLTRVLPTAARQIHNFLLATIAEGRSYDGDDEAGGGGRLESITCSLQAAELQEMLKKSIDRLASAPHSNKEEEASASGSQRLETATYAAVALIQAQRLRNVQPASGNQSRASAARHLRQASLDAAQEKDADVSIQQDPTTGCDSYSFQWMDAYRTWLAKLKAGEKRPYEAQWLILEIVHDRQVREYIELYNVPQHVAEVFLRTCISTPLLQREAGKL